MYEQQAVYQPPNYIICKLCNKPIYLTDRAVYFHHGVLGRGAKSGQPVVVDDELTSGEAVVHELCSAAHTLMSIVDSTEEVENVLDTLCADIFGVAFTEVMNREDLCARCEAQIDVD